MSWKAASCCSLIVQRLYSGQLCSGTLQVVLARQLANQPPSQLPLQRLTSEQMQQLQVQVQQDRLRQVSFPISFALPCIGSPMKGCLI